MAIATGDQHAHAYTIRLDQPGAGAGPTVLDLVLFLWRRKILLVACTLVGAIVAINVTPWFDRLYKAEVVVLPVDVDYGGLGISALAERFAGEGGAATLSFRGRSDKREALAVLTSRLFNADFIRQRNLMPLLFPERWDAQRGTWHDDVLDPPTLQDAVTLFDTKVRDITENPLTGLIGVSVTWTDRQLAAEWANALIEEVNDVIRSREIAEAQASIEQLQRELATLDAAPLRQEASELLGEQLQTVILARVRANYAFQVIDPAVPPESDAEVFPSRFIAAILGASAGGVLGLALAGALSLMAARRERRGG